MHSNTLLSCLSMDDKAQQYDQNARYPKPAQIAQMLATLSFICPPVVRLNAATAHMVLALCAATALLQTCRWPLKHGRPIHKRQTCQKSQAVQRQAGARALSSVCQPCFRLQKLAGHALTQLNFSVLEAASARKGITEVHPMWDWLHCTDSTTQPLQSVLELFRKKHLLCLVVS